MKTEWKYHDGKRVRSPRSPCSMLSVKDAGRYWRKYWSRVSESKLSNKFYAPAHTKAGSRWLKSSFWRGMAERNKINCGKRDSKDLSCAPFWFHASVWRQGAPANGRKHHFCFAECFPVCAHNSCYGNSFCQRNKIVFLNVFRKTIETSTLCKENKPRTGPFVRVRLV